MDDINDIRDYYDRSEEEGRLSKHQLERDLTWLYLDRFLPPEGPLLELGAAAGAYTVELARRGYAVTAVDLSPGLTDMARQRVADAGLTQRVQHLVADARDLGALAGQRYRAALLMGPLYHLVYEADRRSVLRQVRELLVPGGILVSAHICRLGILGDLLKNVPTWIQEGDEVRAVLSEGRDPDHYPRGTFRGYFCRPEEVAPLHESEGYRTLVLAAVEPGIGADDESYNRLREPLRSAWLQCLWGVSAEASMIGASRHLLYIGERI